MQAAHVMNGGIARGQNGGVVPGMGNECARERERERGREVEHANENANANAIADSAESVYAVERKHAVADVEADANANECADSVAQQRIVVEGNTDMSSSGRHKRAGRNVY